MKGFVSFGEVLLRLSSASGQRFEQAHALDVHYGGSEANVSSALARWNIPSSHVTVLPEQETGRAACQALIKAGVNTRYVRFHPGRIGIYFLEQGNAVRSPKVIYDRYHSAFSELNPADFNWKEILKDAQWFHWSGITPAISQAAADACRDAIHIARKLNIKISADINYRSILWQYGKKPIDILNNFSNWNTSHTPTVRSMMQIITISVEHSGTVMRYIIQKFTGSRTLLIASVRGTLLWLE